MNVRDRISLLVEHESTDDEMLQWLSDGIGEISHRLVQIDPRTSDNFQFTDMSDNSKGLTLYGEVTSIVRENGTKGEFEVATRIPSADRFLATDQTSLKYRSKYNPAYYILNKSDSLEYDGDDQVSGEWAQKIYVIPNPSNSSTSNQRAFITQIFYKPSAEFLSGGLTGDTDSVLDSKLIHILLGDKVLYAFPQKWDYVAILYIAIKILEKQLVFAGSVDEDEELVTVLSNTKSEYQAQYDKFFTFFRGPQQGGGDEG